MAAVLGSNSRLSTDHRVTGAEVGLSSAGRQGAEPSCPRQSRLSPGTLLLQPPSPYSLHSPPPNPQALSLRWGQWQEKKSEELGEDLTVVEPWSWTVWLPVVRSPC